jgi:hypothetical protein
MLKREYEDLKVMLASKDEIIKSVQLSIEEQQDLQTKNDETMRKQRKKIKYLSAKIKKRLETTKNRSKEVDQRSVEMEAKFEVAMNKLSHNRTVKIEGGRAKKMLEFKELNKKLLEEQK